MTESHSTSSPNPIDVRQLANAIRFVLVAIVFALSMISLKSSLAIDGFDRIFRDMLGGKPLPALTQWILEARFFLVVIGSAVPVIAVGTLMFRNVIRALYVLGVLGFVSVAEAVLLGIGLMGALYQIISAMGAGS